MAKLDQSLKLHLRCSLSFYASLRPAEIAVEGQHLLRLLLVPVEPGAVAPLIQRDKNGHQALSN